MNDFLMSFLKRMRLLPVLVVVASLSFMVRIGDTFMEIKHMSGAAYAEDVKPAIKEDNAATPPKEPLSTPEEAAADKKMPEDISKEKPPSGADAIKLPSPADNSKSTRNWTDSESDLDDSGVRADVYKDLMERRQMLEQKEKDLDRREALLKAGTEEVNKKVEELSSIKNEIQSLLKKQTSEDEANTARLVKIYEGMKPKDAARIFDQLDMDVLLSVVTKMSERKVSPILAVMNPEKARSLTLFLSEQNKLPGASSAPSGFGDPMKPPALPESAVR